MLYRFNVEGQDDETSLQLSDSAPRSRQTFVDDGYGGNLPPDLLAFPSRYPQSPSLQSSVSNINEQKMYIKQPLINTTYGQLSGFRTLQHPKIGRTIAVPSNRSNSPFLPGPIIYPATMKPGYVTVPRKNRTPSWTPTITSEYSSVSPTSPLSPELVEPVYDNLGLRTTAAGSSTLNLNKLSIFSSSNLNNSTANNSFNAGAHSKISMKDRPLPDTPKLSESTAASALHENGQSNTNSNNLHNNSNSNKSSIETVEPLYSSANPGKQKIPPRPPPKPKKKPQLITNGESINDNTSLLNISSKSNPLENPDGTEV